MRRNGWRCIASTTAIRTWRATRTVRCSKGCGRFCWATSISMRARRTRKKRSRLSRRMWAMAGSTGIFFGIAICMSLLGPIWGGIAFLVQAGTYIFFSAVVNGANHALGSRNFENTATNLQIVALLTAGEGLHNNHHAYPTSARFSIRRGEIDPSWIVVKILSWLHLARPLRLAPQLES